jgi:hypothetical protein
MGSWLLFVGETGEIGRFLEFLAHGSTERHAMDLGVAASERARQTASCMKRPDFFKGIWHS